MFELQEDGRTRIGESRNLIQLSKVVASDEGIEKFRRGMALEQAFRFTDGLDDEFDSVSTRIQSELRSANSIVAEVKFSDARLTMVTQISRQARQLKSAFEENDDD